MGVAIGDESDSHLQLVPPILCLVNQCKTVLLVIVASGWELTITLF